MAHYSPHGHVEYVAAHGTGHGHVAESLACHYHRGNQVRNGGACRQEGQTHDLSAKEVEGKGLISGGNRKSAQFIQKNFL